jgi:thiol:disulfide interchange protein
MSRDFAWFLLWTVVGAAYGLAVAGALTIGIFVLPVAAITERSSPWPFLVSALILVLGSLALFAVLRRRDRRRTTGRARAVT